MKVSCVVPFYNEQETLSLLINQISEELRSVSHELIFVDDGSTDASAEIVRSLLSQYPGLRLIRFRRNMGKASALAAAFSRVSGDYVIMMDADLQDDPKEISRFIAKLDEGYDLVCGWKKVRHDPWHKTFPSKIYNALTARLFRLPIHDINCGFKAFRGEVVSRIKLYGELHRLIPVLVSNLGYRVTEMAVEHHPRRFGHSKYGFERFLKGALDILAQYLLKRHGDTPMHLWGRIAAGGIVLTLLDVGSFMMLSERVGMILLACLIGWIGGGGLIGFGMMMETMLAQKNDSLEAIICEDTYNPEK